MTSVGFGLAQIKPEGMSYTPDDPSIPPWDGLENEFREYFAEISFPWYLKWLTPIFRNIAFAVWNHALLTNAKAKKDLIP